MNNAYTENLADFGYREIKELNRIFTAWLEHGLPDGFDLEQVRPAFNANSGNVFLVNENYQVAMMNGDTLDIWHSTPYGGHEGFLCDLEELSEDELNQEDIDFIEQLKQTQGA